MKELFVSGSAFLRKPAHNAEHTYLDADRCGPQQDDVWGNWKMVIDISRAETGGGRAAPTVVGGLRRLLSRHGASLASRPESFGSGSDLRRHDCVPFTGHADQPTSHVTA
jgi:hypothetical protein